MHGHNKNRGQIMMATTHSIIAGEPPNNTNGIINLSIGDSYGYSVVGARLMVVERGHCGRRKIWSCELCRMKSGHMKIRRQIMTLHDHQDTIRKLRCSAVQ